MPEVKKKTGFSRATIYRRMKKKTFPQSVPIGDSDSRQSPVGWFLDEIDTWLEERDKARQAAGEHYDESAAA